MEKERKDETVFSPEAVLINNSVVYFCRVCAACAAGVLAGTLGLAIGAGALLYMVAYAVLSLMLLVKMRGDPGAYFPSTWAFIADGLFQGGLSYVLFWTITFNVVHVY